MQGFLKIPHHHFIPALYIIRGIEIPNMESLFGIIEALSLFGYRLTNWNATT